MKEYFTQQLEEARAAVPEPPQAKIKLKVPGAEPAPSGVAKKITIHVGGRGSVASSTPQTPAASAATESVAASGLRNSTLAAGSPETRATPAPPATPWAAASAGEDANQSPLARMAAVPGTPLAHTIHQGQPTPQVPNGNAAGVMTHQAFAPMPMPTAPRNPIWENPWRPEGKGAYPAA